MYNIYFYKDRRGKEPVLELLRDLSSKKDKNSRINASKINDYLQLLTLHGTTLGEPYIKHLENDIWELRPLRNRILFAIWNGNNCIILHHFIKKTQKTPKTEIEQAKRNLQDFLARSNTND